MSEIDAIFFDGRTPRRHPARLSREGGAYVVRGAFGEVRADCAHVTISEPLAASPRLICFPEGEVCELRDPAAAKAWLQSNGYREGAVVQWQSRWHHALLAVLISVLLIAACYVWLLPATARILAPRIPASSVQKLSDATLTWLDQAELVTESHLPAARQLELREQVALLARQAGIAHRLHFRHSRLGPNAFALPSGDIVLLDPLVELAGNDEEIMGVIAHELGHVARQHSMRQLIQSSVVSFIIASYFGDISSAASGLAAMVLQSSYSREFEYEADDYAVALFRRLGRSPEALANMLARLEAGSNDKTGAGRAADGGRRAKLTELFSSHPDTRERIARIRAAH